MKKLAWTFVALSVAGLSLACSSSDDGADDGGTGSSTSTGGSTADGGSSGTGSSSSGTGSSPSGTGASSSGTGGETSGGSDCGDAWCEAIVSEHNKIRSAVNAGTYYEQPKAEPPLELVVWDPLIAAKAQAYADTITDFGQGHSSSEYRTYKSIYYDGYHGENMAIGGGSYAEPSSFVAEGWGASEAQGCQLASCGGHYTQIVWRESTAIGCGKKDNVTFSGGAMGTLTVCQYGPGGNIGGRDPY